MSTIQIRTLTISTMNRHSQPIAPKTSNTFEFVIRIELDTMHKFATADEEPGDDSLIAKIVTE